MYLKNFEENLPAVLYSICFFKKGGLTKQDIYSIENKLRRCKKKYPYISYLLAVSDTSSKYCVKRKIKIKNKRGKLPTRVIGEKVDVHVHLSIIGDKDSSAYKCAKDIQKYFNCRCKERSCTFTTKGKNLHAKNFINYSLKQASSIRKCGIFNDILEERYTLETDYL